MHRSTAALATLWATFLTAAIAAGQPTLAWSNRFDGPTSRYDMYHIAELDTAGNLYLTGMEVDSGATGGNPKPLVMKIGLDGTRLWTAPQAADFGPGHLPKRAVATADALYVTGTIPGTSIHGTGINKATVWKFRALDGVLEWKRTYDDAPFQESISQDIAIDAQGNVVICGSQWNDGGFYPGNDAFVQKFDSAGVRLWTTVHNDPINGLAWGQGFHHIKCDSAGNVIVAGTHAMGGPSEVLTFKYNGATGAKLWEHRYTGSGGGNSANTLLLASNGDPILALNTQVTLNNETRSRIGFLRLSGLTGLEQWLTIETLPLYYQFTLRDQVALDPSDNVVATLMYDTDGNLLAQNQNNNSMRTFKFNGLTGARIWAVDHGNNIRWDWQNPTAVQTDAAGNVYVVGHETLPDPNLIVVGHTMIRRHDAATGAVTWYEKFVGEGYESPFRARFDANGDLILAGTSFSSATSQDLWAAKFTGAGPSDLAPSGVTLVHGVPRGGNTVSSLVASDDARYRVRMNFETSRLSPKVVVDTVTNVPSPTVSRFDIHLEARSLGAPVTQAIHIWNGSAWIQVDSAVAATADTSRTVSVTTGAGSYLIGGQIKVRITYFTLDRENLNLAEGQVDRLRLTTYP